ncbi:type I-B CRISPR-associated endonuclease Cas1 [Candidatus Bathyarchaeota archaeon]|nr:type I-B CRISPR-associated endonuclease Cas1 [Candidatus Bathyarchaeota archaeon]
MRQEVYISTEGILLRSGNTLYFMNREGKKALPVDAISDIYCYGKVTMRSGAVGLLLKKGIPVHFFNKYGFYEGSLSPRIQLNSGLVIIKQCEHSLDPSKRAWLAAEIVKGVKHNVLQTLKYYRKRGKDVDQFIKAIEAESIDGDVPTIMSAEGRIWANYYRSFGSFIRQFEMTTRDIRPPSNEMNALISFGNSLLYSTVLSEIYHTYLHPSISFLHEPSERRFSLALDVADLFKPVIVERVIFSLVNNRILERSDFDKDIGVTLNDRGRRLFLREYEEKLETTIMHPSLKRRVSYRHLIRLELYKLIKHILGDKPYESFKMWW